MTEEQKMRWRNDIEGVKKKLREDNFSGGASKGVVYSSEDQHKYGISEFGRMERKGEAYVFRAGTMDMSYEPRFEMPEAVDFSMARNYLEGEPIPLSSITSSLPLPKLKYNQHGVKKLFAVEKAMFDMVHSIRGQFVLLNPSYVTLLSAAAYKPQIIMTDKQYKSRVAQQVREISFEWLHLPELFIENPKDMPVYIGMNPSPRKVVDGWRLVLNPYNRHEWTDEYSVKQQIGVISVEFKKEDRMVTTYLPRFYEGYAYAPESIAAAWKCSTDYVLLSSFSWPIKDIDVQSYPHTPTYLQDLPPYVPSNIFKDHPGSYVAQNAYGEIVDVRGPGTYNSRRARFQIMYPDIVWERFTQHGKVPIHIFTSKLSVESIVECLTLDKSVFRVYSKHQVELVKKTPENVKFSYRGVMYQSDEGGTYVIPGYPKGFMHYCQTFTLECDSPNYLRVLVPEGFEGEWLLYPTLRDFINFKVSNMVKIVTYQTFLTQEDVDSTYQGKSSIKLDVRVYDELMHHPLSCSGAGVPVDQVISLVDTSMPVSLYTSKMRICLKDDKLLYMPACERRFADEGRDTSGQVSKYVGGMLWKVFYERLIDLTYGVFFCSNPYEVNEFFLWMSSLGVFHKWLDVSQGKFAVNGVLNLET